MKTIENQLQELLNKSAWSEEEKNWMLNYLQSSDSAELKKIMQEHYDNYNLQQLIKPEVSERLLKTIHEKIEKPKHTKRRIFQLPVFRLAAASIILLIITAGVLYFTTNNSTDSSSNQQANNISQTDVLPGGDKAILTLDNGQQIVLDTAANGTITQQGNVTISKLNGQLTYSKATGNEEVLYNTITTPKGGQYKLELADGSKVWLNAASSIRFPTAFINKERLVEITGEAYFEISKDASKPFKVLVNKMQVEVLGTHFNINAYNDEADIKTTLLEGSVKVSKEEKTALLKPGEQAQLNAMYLIVNKNVNLQKVIAWKNGAFDFNGESLQSAMRQIARWYDVDVVYEKGLPDIEFGGKVQRNLKLSQIIKGLEDSEIHFRIEGRKLIVLP